MKRGLVLSVLVLGAACPALRADQMTYKFDERKVSSLADKRFNVGTANGLEGIAPGFDKQFTTPGGASGLINKNANLGGRDVYGATLDYGKTFPTRDSEAFDKASPLAGKESSLGGKVSPLPMQAKLDHFDHIYDDKEYRGREAERVRDVIDRLQDQSNQALSRQMVHQGPPGTEDPRAKDGPRRIAPLINVDDVKILVDKDVAPKGPWTARVPIGKADGADAPMSAPSAEAAPSAETLKP